MMFDILISIGQVLTLYGDKSIRPTSGIARYLSPFFMGKVVACHSRKMFNSQGTNLINL
jgi:hypothetical protein